MPAEEPTRQSLPPLPPAVGGRGVKLSAGVMALLGQTIEGRYVIRGVIGEGGMGAVYEAEQRPLGRKVALKVLHPSNAQKPEAVSRFQHEARVVSSIGHPNICELYDVGKLADGAPYLVMERLVGDSLADRITREGALPVEDVLETLLQILGGLGAAHRKGVVHRDVKPDNIFLARTPGSTEPIAKLLDFGISKMSSLDADMHLTRTGMVMGTPYYMAPEQARGEQLDHRVDLYAMGVILYEALTGKRPFVAPNYNALLVQILSGKPKPLRSLRPALLESFEPVVTRALQKSPDARFQSASEFHEALLKLRAEVQREARRAPKPAAPAAPARPAASAHPSGVDIPVHFSPGTDSGEVRPAAERRPSPDPSRRAPTEASRRAGSRPASPPRGSDAVRRPPAPAAGRPPAPPARPDPASPALAPLPLGPSGLPRFGDELSRGEGSPFFTITPSMLEGHTQVDDGAPQFDDATQVAPPPVMGDAVPPSVPSDAVPPVPARARRAPAAPPVPVPASVAAAPPAAPPAARTPSVPPPPGLGAPPVPPPPVPAAQRASSPEIPITVSPSAVMPMVIPPPPPVPSSEVGARGPGRAAMRASVVGQRPPPAPRAPRPPETRPPESERTVVSRPLAADEAEEIIRAARSRAGAPRSRPSRPVAAPAAAREPAAPRAAAAPVKGSAVPPPPPVPRAPREAPARPPAPPAPPSPPAAVAPPAEARPPAQPFPAAPARRAPAMPVFETDEPDEEPTRLFQPGQVPLPPDLEELLRKKRDGG